MMLYKHICSIVKCNAVTTIYAGLFILQFLNVVLLVSFLLTWARSAHGELL